MINRIIVVKFDKEDKRTYDYLGDPFLDIQVGNKVIVPCGESNKEKEVEVVGLKDETEFPIEKLKKVIRICTEESRDRTEWLEVRKAGIGGSDAAAILGLSPYKTNIELWEEKTGRSEAKNISNKQNVEYGKKAEDYIIKLFELENPKYEVVKNGYNVARHKSYSYIIGTVDATLKDNETEELGVLEIKTCEVKSSLQRSKWIDSLPKNYEIQLYHYLLVTGYDFAILRVRLRENNITTEKDYYITRKDPRTEANINLLLEKEIEFWEGYVEKDKCPPLILAEI